MPRRVSLKKPICICCCTNRCQKKYDIFCKQCKNFINVRLALRPEYISKIIHFRDYTGTRRKVGQCSLCDTPGIIHYVHPNTHTVYWLCQAHLNRWLKIGCELAEFINMIGDDVV